MGERTDEMNRGASALDQDSVTRADDAGTEETAEIRADIEQTRAEMSETIEAIQERLSPQHLKDQVKEQVREQFQEAKATVREATIGKAEDMVRNAGDTISQARYTLMDTIRQNPIPAAMVGIGLGWLFMNSRSSTPRSSMRYGDREQYYSGGRTYYVGERGYYRGQEDYPRGSESYGGGIAATGQQVAGTTVRRAQEAVGNIADRTQEAVGGVVNQAQETVGGVVNQAQETVSGVVNQAQEAAGYISGQAQFQAQRLEDRFQQALYENPLAVAAVAVALGTAVGFVLPQTQRENELLGEARDNLVDRAQTVAQDTIQKVQRVAGDVIEEVQTTASDRARAHGLTGE